RSKLRFWIFEHLDRLRRVIAPADNGALDVLRGLPGGVDEPPPLRRVRVPGRLVQPSIRHFLSPHPPSPLCFDMEPVALRAPDRGRLRTVPSPRCGPLVVREAGRPRRG